MSIHFKPTQDVSNWIANEKRAATAIRLLWDYSSTADRRDPEFLCLLASFAWVNGTHGPDDASRRWRNKNLAAWIGLNGNVTDATLKAALVRKLGLSVGQAHWLVSSILGFSHYYKVFRTAFARHVSRHRDKIATVFDLVSRPSAQPSQKVYAAARQLLAIPRFKVPRGRSSVINALSPALACLDPDQRFPIMNQRTKEVLSQLGRKPDADGARALSEIVGTRGIATAFHLDVYSQFYSDKFAKSILTGAKKGKSAPTDIESGLTLGGVYTRADLKASFGIRDATLNSGVFPYQERNEIWLFVTEKKTADRTQYKDTLVGNELRWQGQTAGRTDRLIVEHSHKGQRLLVFYRDHKYQFVNAGFRYEGEFSYKRHRGSNPTTFLLIRKGARRALPDEQGDDTPFDPKNIRDGREMIQRTIRARRGQPNFRALLRSAYRDKCAFSGCDVLGVLEAAHISPYMGVETNRVTNGLLLRADLHTLFDSGLITIEPSDRTIVINRTLMNSEYWRFHGKKVRATAHKKQEPSAAALTAHNAMLSDG